MIIRLHLKATILIVITFSKPTYKFKFDGEQIVLQLICAAKTRHRKAIAEVK